MISTAIVDSGPLIAAANRSDPAHQASLAALEASGIRLVIPVLCVAEVVYFLARYHLESRFLRALEGFDVQGPAPEDWSRIADLVDQYADFPLGGTDASVIVLAERLQTDLIITLDRRHFGAVKPLHCERFRLLPRV